MRTYARALTAAALIAGVILSTGAVLAAHATFSTRTAASAASGEATEPGAQTTPTDTEAAKVDAYLRERMDATKTPGMAYAIVSPESIEHIGTWGENGDGAPITADTPFLWGSVSKPVTATAVMTLVENGSIDLDKPVHSYVPEFTLADEELAGLITVRHLLEQTSGIPEGTGATDRFGRRQEPYADAVADLADVQPLSVPGEEFEYASENYLLLGAVVEAVADQPFHEYLRKHVLGPLEMTGAITTPDGADDALADGHSYAFGQPVSVPAHYDQSGPSYGYLGGTVQDLAQFAMAHLNDGAYGSVQVLGSESVELAHAGAAHVTDSISYGFGWRDDTRNEDLGTRTVWHSGAVHGYQATLVLLPELERGIVVVQNIYGFFQDWELVATGLNAGRILAGGEPEPISSGPAYAFTLGGLVATLAGIAGATGWPAYRTLRGQAAPAQRRRTLVTTACWTVAGLALAYVAGVALPDSVGAGLPLIRLWAPDVGWLLSAVVVGSLLLATARLTTGVVRFNRIDESHHLE
ncbi:serine hydrolase domain-containing protein [Phytoactinopolyspora endophytica]|uniref:serine hydrolase domain-containing protein n=1 Tax=Phytoactinopolyspora endophytica TaxID=1642495 RepID=UPI00101E1F9B|nr:serine hydrolase domain-containing protein [Phytoactinopolyspora endophytica]